VDTVRPFYRDFGLAETRPGRFETADGGEQLRIEGAPRRSLLAVSIGVDDADDLVGSRDRSHASASPRSPVRGRSSAASP
jgi:hypothetical protein